MLGQTQTMPRGVLTVVTDKQRARGLLQASLERLGYRVVPFDDVREAAAYVEADLHLLDCGSTRDLSADLHRLEESAPVLVLMPPGTIPAPAFGQASAGSIAMAARPEEYERRLDIARSSTYAGSGYRPAAPARLPSPSRAPAPTFASVPTLSTLKEIA
jgi:DNA-binding NtrC family response regulator